MWWMDVDRVESYGMGAFDRTRHETAALAYYLRMQPWLAAKVEHSLQRSIPKW